MRKSLYKKFFCKKGFTLIELIVVIAIMAVLATAVTPMLMASSTSKTNEKYKQYVLSVLDSAALIAEAYNKGAKNVAGYDIVSSNGNVNWTSVSNCLNTDNQYSYQFQVLLRISANPNSSNNPSGKDYNIKDTVFIYFWVNSENQILPAGAWYIKKGVPAPAYKFDYSKNAGIENNLQFSNPFA